MADRIDAFARRLTDDRMFLASALHRYAASENLDAGGLAAFLNCSPDQLGALGLCMRPRPAHFSTDVARIADRFGIPAVRLATVVRRAEALEALASASGEGQIVAAARDRTEDDTP